MNSYQQQELTKLQEQNNDWRFPHKSRMKLDKDNCISVSIWREFKVTETLEVSARKSYTITPFFTIHHILDYNIELEQRYNIEIYRDMERT